MYLLIDTETGGLDPNKHSLLTVSMIAMGKDLNEYGSIDLAVKHDTYNVTAEALRVNRIDIAAHDARSSYDSYWKLVEFLSTHGLQDKLVPAGWNVSFDNAFMKAYLGKNVWNEYVSYRSMDVQSIVSFLVATGTLDPKCKSLRSTAEFFGLDTSGHHNAAVDTLLTLQVLRKLQNLLS